MSVIVSISTIPTRVQNGTLELFIKSIQKQTEPVKTIYINIPYHFKRFKNLTRQDLENIESMDTRIKVNQFDYDSPLIKYFGAFSHPDKDDFVFIGDDDQEYHPSLLQRMKEGVYDKSKVYQNRYNVVKHGTAGIIHGFVGLMFQCCLLSEEGLTQHKLPDDLWVDDQMMSIYFAKEHIDIVASPVHDFDEIFSSLCNGMEKLGTGGDLALSENTSDRLTQIKELEKRYNVHFELKMSNNSKGRCVLLDTIPQKRIVLTLFNEVSDETQEKIEKLVKINERIDVIFDLYDGSIIKETSPLLYNKSCVKFLESHHGKLIADSTQSLYINLDFELPSEDTILDLLCSTQSSIKCLDNYVCYYNRV